MSCEAGMRHLDGQVCLERRHLNGQVILEGQVWGVLLDRYVLRGRYGAS